MKSIAILHTTPATISSLNPLIKQADGDVAIFNFLDDSILPEINRAGEITPGVRARFYALAQAAAMTKPGAILCACSSVGGLLEECRGFLPVLAYRIDEPMAELAVSKSDAITVAATLQSTLNPTMDLLSRTAAKLGKSPNLEPLLINGAAPLLAQGRMEEYEQLVATRLAQAAGNCSCIVLAQASMAGAAAKIPDADLGSCIILSSPKSGIEAVLKKL